MGFFGHLVASRSAPGTAFPEAEAEPGDWAPGLHVWRVPERLGPDWDPFEAFVDRLVAEVPGGFLSASVLDSDGAYVHVGTPGRDVERCWLHLDGFVSHFVQPWAPFDDDGNPLPEDAAAEQDAEWERMAAAYAEQVRALGRAPMSPPRRAASGRTRAGSTLRRWPTYAPRCRRAGCSSRRRTPACSGRSGPLRGVPNIGERGASCAAGPR